MKNFVVVRLRQESGAAMGVWFDKKSTIANVLNEFTPTVLENASPVIVINGVLAAPDASLDSFPLDSGEVLHMTIQAPTVWQRWWLWKRRIEAEPLRQRHPATSCSTGECPDAGDDRLRLPPNLMLIHLRHPVENKVLSVLALRSTTIEEVLECYTPSCMKNENPDVVINGGRVAPKMTLEMFPNSGDILELTFVPALDW